MRIDGAIFSVERRSVGACIDLAVAFLRTHFVRVMLLTACFAVPFCVLTWWLMARHEWTLSVCLLLFGLVSPLLGAALVGAAGYRLFGDEFSVPQGLWLMLKRIRALLFIGGAARLLSYLVGLFFIFPGYMLAARYGFLSEIFLLEQCRVRNYETRLNDLLNMTYRDLVGRLVAIVAFFGLSVLCLFFLVDAASGTLLGLPILFGRSSGLLYLAAELQLFLTEDPLVGTVLIGLMWLVYPLARLAWMFCYFDVRIAKEGWDVELDFRIEAKRLEGAT